jgi:hypothetical protein
MILKFLPTHTAREWMMRMIASMAHPSQSSITHATAMDFMHF